MSQHRNTVNITLKAQDIQQCSSDPSLRVMVFCAGSNVGNQEIAFPHQSELKVNGEDIKANLRGLKNKPGSTRPVDITSFLRMRPPNYPNQVDFTYALTTKVRVRIHLSKRTGLCCTVTNSSQKFYLCIFVCRTITTEVLVTRIFRKIPRDSVVAESTNAVSFSSSFGLLTCILVAKKASDPDVVATSQNLSLKCPLSYMRINQPCRGLGCSHIQCFDATSYLQLQEQGPQWICPICNKLAPFETLAVDEYSCPFMITMNITDPSLGMSVRSS